MVNLEWYRTFKAVYQTGSLTAASKILFISQPNVSQHLSALESQVGKPLFERKPRLVPTDYGKLFYTQVVEPLEKLEEIETNFKAFCTISTIPLLRIGAVREYFEAICAPAVSRAEASFMISFGLTKDFIIKLVKGELDFVIATQKINEKNIIYEPILTEEFAIVANASLNTSILDKHLKDENWQKAEEWLCTQIWFAYSNDLAVIRRFWLQNFNKRPAIKPKYTIPDMQIILKAIAYGEGLTITADYISRELIELKTLKTIWRGHRTTENTLYLAYDKTKVTNQQIKMAMALAKYHFSEIPK